MARSAPSSVLAPCSDAICYVRSVLATSSMARSAPSSVLAPSSDSFMPFVPSSVFVCLQVINAKTEVQLMIRSPGLAYALNDFLEVLSNLHRDHEALGLVVMGECPQDGHLESSTCTS